MQKVTQTLAILFEVFIEHGFQLSVGQNKTAVLFSWHGEKATKYRKACDEACRDGIPVFIEHLGMQRVPVVNRYKHLGGQLTRTGTLYHEIRIRAATAYSKAVPLKKILQNQQIDLRHRSQLLRSMVWSVFTVMTGSWFGINETEYKAWQGAWFRVTGCVYARTDSGEVPHIDVYQRAWDTKLPMPMETLYLQRLRFFVCIVQENDPFMVGAVLENWKRAGIESWLAALQNAIYWMQQHISDEGMPQELGQLTDAHSWTKLQPFAKTMKKMIKKTEKAHMLRVKAMCEIKQIDREQQSLLLNSGWTTRQANEDRHPDHTQVECTQCGASFASPAALATHEQRKHGLRVAMRRLITDGCCRACRKQFHTRCRLIQHLHHGATDCWKVQFRCVAPLETESAAEMDEQDRRQGRAAHHRALYKAEDDQACRPCTQDEFEQGPPILRPWHEASRDDPTEDELQAWQQIVLLPPGRGDGRELKDRRASLAYPMHWRTCKSMSAICSVIFPCGSLLVK